MTARRIALFFLACVLVIAVSVSLAQPGRRGRGRSMPGVIPADRAGVPDWKVNERFKNDVFTFVRIEYDDGAYGGGRWGGWGYGWCGGPPTFPTAT